MENRIKQILLVPIMLVLGILPLIVRLKVGVVDAAAVEIFHKSEYVDFYSQSKATALIGILIVMLITIFFLHNKAYVKNSKSMLVYMLGASLFIAFSSISAFTSEYKNIAMWGVFDRAEGLIVLVSYVVIMLYALYVFNKEEDYKYIVGALSVAVIATTVIGITQYIGKDIMLSDIGKRIIIPEQFAELRNSLFSEFNNIMITGTLYNPNYVGSFSAMMIPIFGLMAVLIKNKKKKIFLTGVLLCSLFLLFASGSSAGILGTAAAILLGILIFGKKLWEFFQNKKIIILSIVGAAAVLFILSGKLWYGEVKSLAGQSIEMLSPTNENFNYKDYISIKDIATKDGKTTLATKGGSITIAYKKNVFEFYDEGGKKIDYKIENDTFVTTDKRFSNFTFGIFYAKDYDNLMAGLVLLDKAQTDKDGKPASLFLFKGTQKEGVYIMDAATQARADVQYPEAIGFKGKEKIGSGRGYIWSRTLPMLKDTIFKGYGPDTYALKFPQRDYLGKMYGLGHPQIIVDKPHNLYLQIAVNDGIIALIGFLILVVSYIINSFRLYSFRYYYTRLDIIGVATMLAVTGYLVAGIFNDSAISVAPMFWGILGIGIAINHITNEERKSI